MIKRIAVSLVFVHVLWILTCGLAAAQDSEGEAEEKAREIHKRASSDVIFIDDELKALYYQNVQIISILKEIRELLHQKEKEKGE